MGALRRNLIRLIRHFVLHPAAFFAWLAGLLVVVAAILLIPFLAPSIPQSSPAGRVWRWPPPFGRRGERTIRAIVSLAAALAALLLFATATHGQVTTPVGAMPVGWYATGNSIGDYAVGTDRSRRDGGQGQAGGTIRSLTDDPRGFATLQQSIRATEYRGERVRLSGFVKSGAGGLGATSGLWMRVDGPAGSESIDFMHERPIDQGTDWARYDVVVDVPSNAVGVSFGVLLFGQGQVWLDDVALERVGRNVPLTAHQGHMLAVGTSRSELRSEGIRRRDQADAYRGAPVKPVNLSFTDGTRNTRTP